MNRSLASAVSALFLVFGACTGTGPAGPGADQSAHLAGKVTDGSGAALSGTSVRAMDAGGQVVFAATTEADGGFAGEVPPGAYTVAFALAAGGEFSFPLQVPAGEAFFVAAEVRSGASRLDARVFRDRNGDARADDGFVIVVTDVDDESADEGAEEVGEEEEDEAEDDETEDEEDDEDDEAEAEDEEDDEAEDEEDDEAEDEEDDEAEDEEEDDEAEDEEDDESEEEEDDEEEDDEGDDEEEDDDDEGEDGDEEEEDEEDDD